MSADGRCVRYYCTAGGGMHTFLAHELKRKLRATEVEHIPGRVFFRCSSDLQEVMQLKSAERLFLLLSRAPPISLPKNPAKASHVIQQSIVGDPDNWRHALFTWNLLQVEIRHAQARSLKRKRDVEEDKGEGGVSCAAGSERAHTHLGTPEGTHDAPAHRHQGGGNVPAQAAPTFRISCRCSGAVARHYSSQNLSRIIGVAVARELGWKPDLREPTLEVHVYLSDDHSVIGIPLIRHPLASRRYMKHTGLRSTVAWAMTSLCPMKEASVILDPMCGVGTILLEAAQECAHAVFIGMDTEEGQLQKAVENVDTAGQKSRILLVQSSCMAIPLPTASVDVVLCDVPFGRKFSCSVDMPAALPRILAEMERVLCEGGCLIILLSLQLSAQMKKLVNSNALTPQSQMTELDKDPQGKSRGLGMQGPEHSWGTDELALSSLQLQNIHRVSLGSSDGIIHTYTKIQTLKHTHANTHTHDETMSTS
ncbi:THUMP domain-containing protein 2 isoform X1 [Electrophorus electricus]|uniref:THUMP domain-containing protein n=1 Tax=Electrophorus electricus TaxID=8005 RepID=A0A4W4EW25_ELEEL|nr:THUMP domain-containing protein 2 isoform X1 [Electrophorus electricus]